MLNKITDSLTGYNDAVADMREGWVETSNPVNIRRVIIGMMGASESYIDGYLRGVSEFSS